jgi:hypothetical protein
MLGCVSTRPVSAWRFGSLPTRLPYLGVSAWAQASAVMADFASSALRPWWDVALRLIWLVHVRPAVSVSSALSCVHVRSPVFGAESFGRNVLEFGRFWKVGILAFLGIGPEFVSRNRPAGLHSPRNAPKQ